MDEIDNAYTIYQLCKPISIGVFDDSVSESF